MKVIRIMPVVTSLLLICFSLKAQDSQSMKPIIEQTIYLNPGFGNLNQNLDSLMKIYKHRVLDPNPYFVNTKILAHWWGNDSRQLIFLFELKSWDDIDKAFNKQKDIISHLNANEKDGMGDLIRSLVKGSHHSDEIYQVLAE
jgi:hypothetical protein